MNKSLVYFKLIFVGVYNPSGRDDNIEFETSDYHYKYEIPKDSSAEHKIIKSLQKVETKSERITITNSEFLL